MTTWFRYRMMTMTLVGALGLIVLSPAANAGGATVCLNCSSWVTQLAQQIQQVRNTINTAQTVRNGLQQAVSMERELKGMNASTLLRLSGGPVNRIHQMTRMYDQTGRLMNDYSSLRDRMMSFQQQAIAHHMTGQQYLQFQAQLAQSKGSVYKSAYASNQQMLASLNAQSQQLAATAATIPSVTGQVAGLQALLAQNVGIRKSLVQINAQMALANEIALQNRMSKNNDKNITVSQMEKESKNYNKSIKDANKAYAMYSPIDYNPNTGGNGNGN